MENDRAERSAYNKQRRLDAVRDREIDDALRALMQHSQGRRTIYWFLELGRTGQNPFTGNALTTAFACGELNVSKAIEARVISVAPDFYLTMLKEMENERTHSVAAGDTSGDDDTD
jgi:hypothetical protein